MIKNKKHYFVIGLSIFYLLLFLSPFKIIYFASYFVATFFFYLATNNIQKSLLYSLILSLFSDFGLAKSIFMMQPEEFNLGPGYSISPMTAFIFCLLPFTFLRKMKTIRGSDVFVVLFFASTLISFYVFPYTNVLFGIISLGELILLYFILRTLITEKDFENISIILISLMIFQTILGGIQFLFQQPIGQIAEQIITNNPYGLVTREDTNLFRVSGTFAHPNFLASFILVSYPFLLLFPSVNIYLNIFKVLAFIILIFTYSRAAWVVAALIGVLLLFTKQIKIKIPKEVPLYYYLILIILTAIFIYLTPYLNARLNSFPYAFEEGGSMDVRFKLLEEGISLVTQYPVTGVGLNRSREEYISSPVTDYFEKYPPVRFTGIHNTPLEIASEVGIPGIFFLIMFLFYVFKNYLKNKKIYLKNAAFFGLLGLIGISMFNPFFHTSQFRIFFLLAAIILV